jgi:hypothetical protein
VSPRDPPAGISGSPRPGVYKIGDGPEIELSTLTRQCLDRRITDIDTLNTELAAWQHATNTDQRQVQWQFTTADARIKLRHLYPNN